MAREIIKAREKKEKKRSKKKIGGNMKLTRLTVILTDLLAGSRSLGETNPAALLSRTQLKNENEGEGEERREKEGVGGKERGRGRKRGRERQTER